MLGYKRKNEVGNLREFGVNIVSNNVCVWQKMERRKLYWLYVWHYLIKYVEEQPKYHNVCHWVHCGRGKKAQRKFTCHLFSWITGIKFNKLLITFFSLVVTLTSGSGGCDVGTQDVKDFYFSRVGAGALAWFLEWGADKDSAWFDISFVFPLTKSL